MPLLRRGRGLERVETSRSTAATRLSMVSFIRSAGEAQSQATRSGPRSRESSAGESSDHGYRDLWEASQVIFFSFFITKKETLEFSIQ